MRVVAAVALGMVFVVLVACGAGEDGASQHTAIRWERSVGSALDRARSENKLVMMSFHTDWCGWCKRMDRTTYADPRVQQAMERLVPVKLDAEKDGRQDAARYGVRGYPTVVFANSAGEEVARIPGYLEPTAFLEELEDVLRGSQPRA